MGDCVVKSWFLPIFTVLLLIPTAFCGINPLLVVMFDGGRWDNINKPSLTGFRKMKSNGVSAEYMIPVFPSDSYPNWNSIVTGLYPESHGFPSNFLYDEKSDEYFLQHPHPNVSHTQWWQNADPIWVTASKSRKRAHVFGWGGCEVEINQTRPTYCEKYMARMIPDELDYMNRTLGTVLKLFEEKKSDLAMVYVDILDQQGHRSGTDTDEYESALVSLDQQIKFFLQETEKQNSQVNVIMLSDHGMVTTRPSSVSYILIQDVITSDDVIKVIGHGSSQYIVTKPDKSEKVFHLLKNKFYDGMTIYTKETIPESYHIRNNKMLPHIFLAAQPGYYILPLCNELQFPVPCENVLNGLHGYDVASVPEMRAFFIAQGPAFKTNAKVPPIHTVDVYNLMCHLMDIDARPNNGTWSRVSNLLNTHNHREL